MSPKAEGKPKSRTATIMFVDLIGSSDAASYLGLTMYTDYLKAFQDTLDKAWKDLRFENEPGDQNNIGNKEIKGDQGFFLLASELKEKDDKRKDDIKKDIFKMLSLALRIKYTWQLHNRNITRIKQNKKPFEIAIGINTGMVSIENKGKSRNKGKSNGDRITEGYPINLAKRIEGESRKGTYSKIFVGETTYGIYSDSPGENPIRFNKQELAPLKGIAGDIRIYEITYTALEEDESSILTVPKTWQDPQSSPKEIKKLQKALKVIKTYSLATQDSWLINLYCNVKWAQIQYEIERDNKVKEKKYLEVIEMARKLVELDKYFSAWKVYMGRIILNYFKYSLKKSGDIENNIVLLRDAIEILRTLTSNEPYELDARLTLGRFYLEATDPKNNCVILLGKESAKEMAIEQFKRIMVWDDEYEDAYYYLAPALVADDSGESNDSGKSSSSNTGSDKQAKDRDKKNLEEAKAKAEAEECIDELYRLLKKRDEPKMAKIFKEAKADPLFKKLEVKLKNILVEIKKAKLSRVQK